MMNIEQARFNMIEQQIRPWDVLDGAVLGLLSRVRREDFVPPAQRALAFTDTEIPLPEGQCMLAPRVEARLLQELRLSGAERTLEVGAGSGTEPSKVPSLASPVTLKPRLICKFARLACKSANAFSTRGRTRSTWTASAASRMECSM
jgi:protein-L-isoaspartate(D-aspartate) O-methyltransferase